MTNLNTYKLLKLLNAILIGIMVIHSNTEAVQLSGNIYFNS